jgi:hypothetical protein
VPYWASCRWLRAVLGFVPYLASCRIGLRAVLASCRIGLRAVLFKHFCLILLCIDVVAACRVWLPFRLRAELFMHFYLILLYIVIVAVCRVWLSDVVVCRDWLCAEASFELR